MYTTGHLVFTGEYNTYRNDLLQRIRIFDSITIFTLFFWKYEFLSREAGARKFDLCETHTKVWPSLITSRGFFAIFS